MNERCALARAAASIFRAAGIARPRGAIGGVRTRTEALFRAADRRSDPARALLEHAAASVPLFAGSPIDRALGDAGQLLIGGLLFLQRLLEEFGDAPLADDLGISANRSIRGD